MSNGQFDWDDEDQDFRDIPDEVREQATPVPPLPPTKRPAAPNPQQIAGPGPKEVAPPPQDNELQYDDGYEDYEEQTEDYSSVLSDARLRLEQGRLYEMIMNHELFEGVESDPKAIRNVQNEIRTFAKERMEIMLGMRLEAPRGGELGVDLPFNSLEIEALRDIAFKLTKGASSSPEVERYSAPVKPRQAGLAPIGAGRSRPQERRPEPRQEQREQRPLPSKPSAPVKRMKVDPNLEARLRAEGVEQEYIEEAKRQVMQDTYKPIGKQIHEMTEQELRERNEQAAKRAYATVKSPQAVPMATPEQAEAMVLQRVREASSHPSMIRIMDLLNQSQKK